uniref:Uncharacterized protein n=1 Tax=viral metagenome TaxID=1070528 RepID=A0A6C0M0D8_9ZZZZ
MTQPEIDTLVLNSFIITMKQAIRDKKINVDNPLIVITKAMEILEHVNGLSGKEKKMYIIQTIETIAKGDDGIFGTADDLIPERTIRALKTFIEQDIIGDTIQLVTDVSKGKFDINKVQKLGISCFNIFNTCFHKQ